MLQDRTICQPVGWFYSCNSSAVLRWGRRLHPTALMKISWVAVKNIPCSRKDVFSKTFMARIHGPNKPKNLQQPPEKNETEIKINTKIKILLLDYPCIGQTALASYWQLMCPPLDIQVHAKPLDLLCA